MRHDSEYPECGIVDGKRRRFAEDDGVLEAAFDGNHGGFWRNRTDAPVAVTLKISGAYSDIKRMI